MKSLVKHNMLKEKARTLYEISSNEFFSSVSLFVYVWGGEGRGGGCIMEGLFEYSQTGYRLRESYYSIFNTKP